MQPKFNDILT